MKSSSTRASPRVRFSSFLSRLLWRTSAVGLCFNLETFSFLNNFLSCGHLLGPIFRLTFDRISLWSVQQSTLHMAFVTLMSFVSFFLVMMYSIRCQCLDIRCIHDVLLHFGRQKRVFVITKLYVEHNCNSKSPLLLHFSMPWGPMTVFQGWWSDPTLTLKLPRRSSLSDLETALMAVSSSSWNLFVTSSGLVMVGMYALITVAHLCPRGRWRVTVNVRFPLAGLQVFTQSKT